MPNLSSRYVLLLSVTVFLFFGSFNKQTEARPLANLKQGMAKTVAKLQKGVVTGALIITALTGAVAITPDKAVAQDILGKDWKLVVSKGTSDPHFLRSSLYMTIESGDFWRVMHVEYIGEKGELSLFAGARAFIRWGGRTIISKTVNSLVDRHGLVQQGVVVEEVDFFTNPSGAFFNMTVLGIKDLDMRDYKPIELALYPTINADLEMFSYRTDLGNQLNIFSYPMAKRKCVAGNFVAEDWIGGSSCLISDSLSVIGSPIYRRGKLIGTYFGQEVNDNGVEVAYVVGIPYDMIKEYSVPYSVDYEHDKLTTTWGEMKRESMRNQ